jgi:hypothetical protein
MNGYEASPQSFILKVWLEETREEEGQSIWRGHITHVPSGKRRYVQALNEVPAFIAPYLEAMGVRATGHVSFRNWWRRLRTYVH